MLTSIRSRLLFLALAGGVICVAIAGYTYTRVERLQSNDQIALVDMAAMHNHMQGDMMHDALRGDVLSAFVGAEIGGIDRAGLESDLRSHSDEFHAMLAANLALPLKPEVHSALQDIKPSLEAYIASAQNIVALTASDPAKAKAEFPNFQKAFSDLEGRQGTVTELIGKTAEADQAATRELFDTTRKAMTVAVGIAIAIAVLTAIMGIVYARRILRSIEDTVAVLGAMAQGDLTRRVEVREKNEFGRMAESLNSAIVEMGRAMGSVEVASDRMAAASAEVSSATTQLSDGSQQQAAALEETAASLEEITGTVKQNAESARQANQLAVASHSIAEKGGRVVAEAVISIQEISKSSEKIANIISTIDEIAFQTNLLALNAAVEAARAGDQGRGFAVVASEVRTLAKRSATAAKEIKGLIEESLDKVQVGSTLVNRSGESLTEIVASVKRVTDIIAEIAAASEEQATGVEQVNRAVTQMDQVVQSTAGQATELATTSSSLSVQAAELRGLVQQFHLSDVSARTTATSPSTPTAVRAPLAHAPAAPIARKSAPGARGASLRKPVVASKESQLGSEADGFIEF